MKGAARVVAAIGSTGSGKTTWVTSVVKKEAPRRLLIWDPLDDKAFEGMGQVFTDRVRLVDAVKGPAFAVIYRPGDDESVYAERFTWFCRLAWALGDLTFIADELGDVTKPSWAPPAWRTLTGKGRHKGLRIYGMSQRPADVDKKFFGQCTLIHCGRLNYRTDQKVMADALGLENPLQLRDLAPLRYYERDMLTGQVSEGKLTF